MKFRQGKLGLYLLVGTFTGAAGLFLFFAYQATNYQPIGSGETNIQIRQDGAAYQGDVLVGRFLPQGDKAVLHVVFPSQALLEARVDLSVVLPAPVPEKDVVIKLSSIQGTAGMQAGQADPGAITLLFSQVSQDAHPSVSISVPQSTFSVPVAVSLTAGLAAIPLRNWLALSLVLTVGGLAVYWYVRYWRRRDQRGAYATQPPAGLSPLEIAILLQGSIRPSHISALIFDLANRGYLEIVSNRKGVFFIRTGKEEPLRNYEEMVLQLVAPRHAAPTAFQDILAAMNASIFSAVVSGIYRETYKSLEEKGYVADDLTLVHLRYKTAGIILECLGLVGVGLATLVPATALGGPVLLGVSLFIVGRLLYAIGYHVLPLTGKGQQAVEKAQAFRVYLRGAHAYRPDPQPKETVLFPYLPIAIGLGCHEAWLSSAGGNVPYLPTWFTSQAGMSLEPESFTQEVLGLVDLLGKVFVAVKDPNVD